MSMNVVYLCERCSTVIARTSAQIKYIIKKYGGIFCKRCIKGWFDNNERT